MKPSRIFLVEDDVTTIYVLEAYLKSWGYEIAGTARTIPETLEQIRQHPPDLVLLDINLGAGMERAGIELAHLLRQSYAFPIVFLTGQPEIQVMQAAQKTRPDAYLTKPISEASLAFAIGNALQRASERITHPRQLEQPAETSQEEGQYWLLEDALFVKNGSAYQKLPVADILWIQADKQYSTIQTHKGTTLVSTNLGNFARQFEHPSLLRVSRSHIINVHHIEGFEENHLAIIAGKSIPIGKTYRDEVQRRFRFLKTTR